ncbi:hypothetical protein [Collimonas humicola]|uniref:hypothetical protein n=1 Tax=Collimonas humicola TaxID=2825886 RepID=UPI001B8D1A69|nr:hypothetical protein [Collimonas humicola]
MSMVSTAAVMTAALVIRRGIVAGEQRRCQDDDVQAGDAAARCGEPEAAHAGPEFIYTGRGAKEFFGRSARGFAFPTFKCGVVGHAMALQLFTVLKTGKT